jgi:hypothetical protein
MLGLMIDESTDCSNTNMMVLYLRLFKDGLFQTVYWGMVTVTDATGVGLAGVVRQKFEDSDIPMSLLMSLATDGASAMTGEENGAAAFICAYSSGYLLSTHCVAHRHALASACRVRGSRHGAGVKDRNDDSIHFPFSRFRSSFSTGFFTKFIARAPRDKGRARGSQSGDIWTREETMCAPSAEFEVLQCRRAVKRHNLHIRGSLVVAVALRSSGCLLAISGEIWDENYSRVITDRSAVGGQAPPFDQRPVAGSRA